MSSQDPKHDEARLVQAMAAGERRSFRQLYERYGRRMYLYALRRLGDEDRAQDLLQESLLAAWEGAGRFRGEGRLIAWLLKIVHNKSLQILAQRPVTGLEAAHRQPASEETPEEWASRSEQQAVLRRGLERLSPDHRGVLELVFFQGLSLSEVAEVCDCPLGTVKSRLSYAKRALQGELTRVGFGTEDLG